MLSAELHPPVGLCLKPLPYFAQLGISNTCRLTKEEGDKFKSSKCLHVENIHIHILLHRTKCCLIETYLIEHGPACFRHVVLDGNSQPLETMRKNKTNLFRFVKCSETRRWKMSLTVIKNLIQWHL